jgi:yeast amino acid transporter
METKEKSGGSSTGSEEGVYPVGRNETKYYDPSKETQLTRLGLSWESFKRAPGVVAYVPLNNILSFTS